VVSQCSLIAWLNGLASGDQRRLTGSGNALEACSRRCAIQMATFTLLYLLLLLFLLHWTQNKLHVKSLIQLKYLYKVYIQVHQQWRCLIIY